MLATMLAFYCWLLDTWRWRMSPEMWWECSRIGSNACSGVSRYCATYTDVSYKSALHVWDAELPTSSADFLQSFRKGRDIQVRYRSHPKLTLILIHHVTFDALPWTLVYPFVEWVLDSFRGALSIHLVVACKNISFHLLLFFINKCLWKGFNLICCHKQPHITLLWTYGVWQLDWKFMVS